MFPERCAHSKPHALPFACVGEVDFLVGQTVNELRYWGADLRLVFDAGDRAEPALYADAGQCTYVNSDGDESIVAPERPLTVAPVLETVGRQISEASTEVGVLALTFDDGSRLRCEPDDHFEAWQVVGGSPQHLVICSPGGELAVWDNPRE